MKSHVNAPGYASALATRSCARFSPTSSIPASASTPSSSTGTYLTAARIWTSPGSLPVAAISLADAVEVRPDRLGPQARYRLNHAIPACRPVIPPSRRWENSSVGSAADRAQPDVVHDLDAGALELLARDRLEVQVAPVADVEALHRRTPRGRPRRPRSSTARARADRRLQAVRRRPARAPRRRPRRRSRRRARASRRAASRPPRARRPRPAGSRRSSPSAQPPAAPSPDRRTRAARRIRRLVRRRR